MNLRSIGGISCAWCFRSNGASKNTRQNENYKKKKIQNTNHQTTETALYSVMSHKHIRQVCTKMLKQERKRKKMYIQKKHEKKNRER